MDEITFENDFFKMKNAIDSLLNDEKIPNAVKQALLLSIHSYLKHTMTDEEIVKYNLEKKLKKEKKAKNKLIKELKIDFTNYFENNDDTSLVL